MLTTSVPQEANLPVYVEKINKSTGWLLLDFPDNKYYSRFKERIGENIISDNDKRSMIEVFGVSFKGVSTPREGSFYEIPETLLSESNWATAYEQETQDNEHSSVIAFTVNLQGVILQFGRAVSKRQVFGKGYFEKKEEPFELIIPEIDQITKWSKNTKITAWNVGQGNWNEIYFGDGHAIIYDLGVSIRYSANQIKHAIRKSKIGRLEEDIDLKKCILIISHWDVDHYKAILEVEDENINSLGRIIYMADPISLTAQRALDKIKGAVSSSTQLIEVAPAPSGRGKGKSSELHCIYSKNGVKIFKGTKSANRNKSGLSLCVFTQSSCAILPADHHYDQIDKHILPHVSNSMDTYLIVPHHGGHAGKYKLLQNIKKAKHAVISVGDNQWKHPFSHVKNELKNTFKDVWDIKLKDEDYSEILT